MSFKRYFHFVYLPCVTMFQFNSSEMRYLVLTLSNYFISKTRCKFKYVGYKLSQ